MAKRIFTNQNWTPTATADTTALANATYMALKGGSSTQLINILEFMISGFSSSATAIALLTFARVTTVETTPTALASPASDGPMHPSTAALAAPPVSLTAAAAGPQRSAATTDAKINLGINTFGGILKYNCGPGQEFSIIGNTQPLGEAVLSAFTGGAAGAISADIIYEPL